MHHKSPLEDKIVVLCLSVEQIIEVLAAGCAVCDGAAQANGDPSRMQCGRQHDFRGMPSKFWMPRDFAPCQRDQTEDNRGAVPNFGCRETLRRVFCLLRFSIMTPCKVMLSTPFDCDRQI